MVAVIGSTLASEAGSSDAFTLQVELFEDMGAESPDEKTRVTVNLSDAVGVIPESLNDDAIELNLNDTAEPDGEQRIRSISKNQVPDHVYQARAFGFHRLPFKYDETGVRELQKGPIEG